MQCRKVLVWSHIHRGAHKLLTEDEQKIGGSMPLIEALFPGINYYSITGHQRVVSSCLVPVLQKLFPELVHASEEDVTNEEMVEITEFLPSKGYEWQGSERWQKKFQKLLAAT